VGSILDVDQHDPLRDEAIDTSRYVAAIRRSAWLIVAIVVLWTLGTWATSLFLPPTFESSGEIILTGSPGATNAPADSDAINRELATLEVLATTSSVLRPAADQLATTVEDLRDLVTASVEDRTSMLVVTARGGSADIAQTRANAVMRALIEQRREFERARLEASIEGVSTEIVTLETASALEPEQRATLLERRAELTVAAATAGDDLQVAQEAELPSEPVSPRPLRNAVIASFGSLCVAVLLAVLRDRRRAPRLGTGVEGAQVRSPEPEPGSGTAAPASTTEGSSTSGGGVQGVESSPGPEGDGARPRIR
jgi:capsular polysaccharide biosynthesis protein